MRVQWAMLANAVEVRDGLLNMLGGAWDSIAVTATPEAGAPLAVMRSTLVLRVLLDRTETGREHTIEARVVDADGAVQAHSSGTFSAPPNPDLPIGWDQGLVLPISLSGARLSRLGGHEVTILIDGEFLYSVPFQVVDRR
jgi:hypothetical protein